MTPAPAAIWPTCPTPSPFSAWSGPRDARTVIVGEAWGEDESRVMQPFVGWSGKELWRMLGQAWGETPEWTKATEAFRLDFGWVGHRRDWLESESVAFTNVFNFRPPDNRLETLCGKKSEVGRGGYLSPIVSGQGGGKYLHEQYLCQVHRLWDELLTHPRNLVIPVGNASLWALLGTTGIGKLRGVVSVAKVRGEELKVLPTYHPAAVLRQWDLRVLVVADLIKAKVERAKPEVDYPNIQILYNPTRAELEWGHWKVIRDHQATGNPLSFDVETAKRQIKCISFSADPGFAMTIPFWDKGQPGWNYWQDPRDELAAWLVVKDLMESDIPKLAQNGMYDMQYLAQVGLRLRNCRHDTMLRHHSIMPEMQKGLGFLGSLYTRHPEWKSMRAKAQDSEKRDE